jgi:hypothetical protein
MTETFSVGDRVMRTEYDNTTAVPVGSIGSVVGVSAMGGVLVKWDKSDQGVYNSASCLQKVTPPQFIHHGQEGDTPESIALEQVDSVFPASDPIGPLLKERGRRYGSFDSHAKVTYDIKRILMPFYHKMEDDQREALDMICHKLGRIVNGDPNYADSWVDIAGYAQLVADRLQKQ